MLRTARHSGRTLFPGVHARICTHYPASPTIIATTRQLHRSRSRPSDPQKQAAGIVKRLQGGCIRSVGTVRYYQERLAQIAVRLGVALTALTPDRAIAYLRNRAVSVGQKTLDMERQAMAIAPE